jgi:pyruvate-formate lyase-activating enzyme
LCHNRAVKRLVAIEHEHARHAKVVVVNWCLGNICNHSCSYCPSYLHDSSVPWVPFEVIRSFCDRMIEHYRARLGRELYFEFTGGEVSHYREFPRVLRFLAERKARVGIISNGSKALGWWEEAKPYLEHVCLSFHPEFSRPDHFKAVLELLAPTATVHLNVMMDPRNFDYCLELARWTAEHVENVSVAIQPLLKDFGSEIYPYTPEQQALLRSHDFGVRFTRELRTYRGRMVKVFGDGSREIVTGPQLVANDEAHWQDWRCSIGLSQLVVDFGGGVYRGWCKVGGLLGSATDESWPFPDTAVRCNRGFCHCVLDVMNERSRR